MSVPPQLIHVKRKADEALPVSYLRVQETKRHKPSFVYQRQIKEPKSFFASAAAQSQKPIIHTSSPSRQATASPGKIKRDNAAANSLASSSTDVSSTSSTAVEPRKFHMSRKDMMLAGSLYPDQSDEGSKKKRSAPALFVERKIKRISTKTVEKLHAASNATPAPAPAPMPTPAVETDEMAVDAPKPRKYKKPGIARKAGNDNTARDHPELPKSMMDRWNVDMEKLTADMEAYAMEQIGQYLQKNEEEKREREKPKSTPSTPLKFKPKAPAKRYAERHPEEAPKPVDTEMVDASVEQDDSDDADGDYIIETYVRVPASSIGENVPPQNVGLLVFDEEPDLEYFYGEEDESDDDVYDDEDDENAENYYAADYPDEEVATDDEYDENAYAFRTGNASDLEEYDLDDDESDHNNPFYSGDDDDDDDGNMGQFKTYVGRGGFRSNHL